MIAAQPASRPPGALYLVPAPLDFACGSTGDLMQTMPLGTLQVAARLEHWICENAKSARAYLHRVHHVVPLAQPIAALTLQELPHQICKKGDHHGQLDASPWLQAAVDGHDMGLVSEVGMPAVADPGASVVRAAHMLGIRVVPLVGPVSLLLALAASGLNGQHFAFVGYLPVDATKRGQRIRALETLALRTGQTQMFIETPYRNLAMLQTLLHTLRPDTRLAVSSGLCLERAATHCHCARDWPHHHAVNNTTPAVFAIGLCNYSGLHERTSDNRHKC